jgi:hypothetical protein
MAMNSFIRALSPAVDALIATSNGDDGANRSARHASLQAATTVEGLISMVPSDYRHVLCDALRGTAVTASKLNGARTIVARWLQHQAAGTLPPHLKASMPEVQLTKDFAADPAGAIHMAALRSGHQKYQEAVLANAIAAKQDDIKFLEASLTPARLYDAMRPAIVQERTKIMARTQLPTFEKNIAGEIVLTGWEENSVGANLAAQVLADCVVYAYRIISIADARDTVMATKISKKKDLAKSADVEMADATKPGPSMQSMIDKAVSARLKAVKPSSKVSTRFVPYSTNTHSLVAAPEKGRFWQEAFDDFEESFSTRGRPQSAAPLHSQAGSQGSRRHERRRREVEEEVGGLRFVGEGQGEAACDLGRNFLCIDNNWYVNPLLIPDVLLTVPYPVAIRSLILSTPVNIIQANSYKFLIHRGPNVSLPKEIELDLSVGMRYLFRSPRNSLLIKEAWVDFVERLRWRLYFAFDKDSENSYDPDYEVPHVRKGKPPRLPQYLELGISLGQNFVNKAISHIPQEEVGRKSNPLVPDRSKIEEFLISKNYVVTMTDKNLGIAVSERTWIDEKCLDLLNDEANYVPLHPLSAQQICDKQCTDMEVIASHADNIFSDSGNQLGKFFRHLITEKGQQHSIPIFYGIPKIHKEPVKMRPIIPCHSAIQNPAAKYVSKKLKPLIQAAPSILKSTKDLAIKLSKVKLDTNRRWFLVTGDVVAFYPSIPLQKCLDIAADMYAKHIGEAATTEELKEMRLFLLCLRTGNENLITRYKDLVFKQTRGLAMGVADSPDLSNLYGLYFENACEILQHPSVPFYGRFIDDIFGIVYAETEASAIDIISTVKFDDCVIEWGASDSFLPFLDMTIYRDADNRLQHMPYRKARSHQERIPWISHHPLDVKRGTYIGEMSRLATLCSLHSHYIDAIKGLCALYIVRGYPSNLVVHWTRSNIVQRWQNRLTDNRREHEDVLVLKSEFNTAWNYFSAKELGDTVLGYWRGWLAAAESNAYSVKYPAFSGDLQDLEGTERARCVLVNTPSGPAPIPDVRTIGLASRKLIVSRKRTRNLFDLTSLWKKTVLTRLERDVLEPEENLSEASNSSSSDESETDPSYLFRTIGYR